VAALACPEEGLGALARRLPPGALSTVLDGSGCVLLPDPEGPARLKPLERAARESPVVVGPTGAPTDLPASWRLARLALRAAQAGALPGTGLLRVDEHLADLLLFESGDLVTRIAARRLAPLDDLTPKARARMRETALAYVQHGGNAVEMAQALHLHPQTVRYRIAQLRELFADNLDDPDARFELEIALRAA
jgi:DNA-binding PucR family transcriptional regulator